jgi:hypothetical protein
MHFNVLDSTKGPLPLWVDSLCINQSDTAERTAQMRQIGGIYRGANAVLVWLGEEDSTSKSAIDLVHNITNPKNLNYKWDDEWWEGHRFRALDSLLARPWFERGWVIQEAACSRYSSVLCGDGKVYMGKFVMAVSLIQSKLKPLVPKLGQIARRGDASPLSNFFDSPAVRLLDIINDAFRFDAHGDNSFPKLGLESLVDLSTFSQTTDHRDAIYALLGLANDIAAAGRETDAQVMLPDYEKPVLDVFADFVMHCCAQSESLDIICRPWAPVLSTGATHNNPTYDAKGDKLRHYPSWIVSRDRLAFGNPSYRHCLRLHGDPLVRRNGKRTYNAHRGTKPCVSVGRREDGSCDGTLHARGFVLGCVDERSTRLASAIVTKDALSMLCRDTPVSGGAVDTPCALWRTLCADRDENGDPAPRVYQTAMFHLLHMTSHPGAEQENAGNSNILGLLSDIDIEEVLDGDDVPEHIRNYLMVVGGVVWNRRAFRCKYSGITKGPLVGLAPQGANVGDLVCILLGCSVPVVLRELPGPDDEGARTYELVGEAFVYGGIDGDLLAYGSGGEGTIEYVDFAIR